MSENGINPNKMNIEEKEMEFDGFMAPPNPSSFAWDINSPLTGLTTPYFDLFVNRRRGSSNTSWRSNRSFNFGTITPLNIPETDNNNNNNNNNNDEISELPKSAYINNPSSLSTVSSIDTTNCNTQDFVRSAPIYGGIHNSWDQVISSWKTPTDTDNAMDLDLNTNSMILQKEDSTEQIPEFMKSNFFMEDTPILPFQRRTSIESMVSLGNPNQPAPQSAPPTQFDGFNCMSLENQIFGNDEWSGIVTNAFGAPQSISIPKTEATSLTISEADIFGNNNDINTRNRNWSNFTTESENEPIIKLAKISGMKRNRGKSLSDGDLKMPPQQRIKRNINDHNGIPVIPSYDNNNNHVDLPPIIHQYQAQITPNIVNGVNNMNMNINNNNNKQNGVRKRGRPRKSAPTLMTKKNNKYSGLKKSEREKLRRKELKEGYQTLTQLLGLTVERSGATLPDRSVIVAAACGEIKRLENKLFAMSMQKSSQSIGNAMNQRKMMN